MDWMGEQSTNTCPVFEGPEEAAAVHDIVPVIVCNCFETARNIYQQFSEKQHLMAIVVLPGYYHTLNPQCLGCSGCNGNQIHIQGMQNISMGCRTFFVANLPCNLLPFRHLISNSLRVSTAIVCCTAIVVWQTIAVLSPPYFNCSTEHPYLNTVDS